MNKERLLRLADVILPAVPEKDFNIRFWECGTVACAAGWACRDEQFQKEGLAMIPEAASYQDRIPTYRYMIDEGDVIIEKRWNALEKFFDIPFEATLGIFNQCGYGWLAGSEIKPHHVTAKIHEYIRQTEGGIA